ncbi:hypothetical protein C4J81_17110 [Deltaproteobacteria bacterium Smac51]|nr:hypothetical protein C4J81_17110 [Deltaproteobacteria bacterium Smac51]
MSMQEVENTEKNQPDALLLQRSLAPLLGPNATGLDYIADGFGERGQVGYIFNHKINGLSQVTIAYPPSSFGQNTADDSLAELEKIITAKYGPSLPPKKLNIKGSRSETFWRTDHGVIALQVFTPEHEGIFSEQVVVNFLYVTQ